MSCSEPWQFRRCWLRLVHYICASKINNQLQTFIKVHYDKICQLRELEYVLWCSHFRYLKISILWNVNPIFTMNGSCKIKVLSTCNYIFSLFKCFNLMLLVMIYHSNFLEPMLTIWSKYSDFHPLSKRYALPKIVVPVWNPTNNAAIFDNAPEIPNKTQISYHRTQLMLIIYLIRRLLSSDWLEEQA